MSFFNRIMAVLRWLRNHKYLFVTVVFLAIVLLPGEKSMLNQFENKNKIDALNKEIADMKRDSAKCENDILRLDKEADRIGRRDYGMHTPQEEVFEICD